MTYKLNGVTIASPETGQWRPRKQLGVSGEGRPIVTGPYVFEIHYGLMAPSDYDAIHDVWLAASATGTIVAELPDILANSYAFREFSGCYMEEPTVGRYYQEYVGDVLVVVTNINA